MKETSNILTAVAMLTALTELLNLQRLELQDESIPLDVKNKIREDYPIMLRNASNLGLELVSKYNNGELGLNSSSHLGNLNFKQLKLNFEKDSTADKVIRESKVVFEQEKDGMREIVRGELRTNAAHAAYSNTFKNKVKETATNKLLSTDDLFKSKEEQPTFVRMVLKSIINYLEDGKRGECVGYLVTYVFKHKGLTVVEAHRLLNDLKDHYNIIEKSGMRNAENKRKRENKPVIPKGAYLMAKYKCYKDRNNEELHEGVVLWPEKAVNNVIVDEFNEFVCLESDIKEFRLATNREIEAHVRIPVETKLEKLRKAYKKRKEAERL